MKNIIKLYDEANLAQLYGWKAQRLGELIRLGFNVPKGVAISWSVFSEVLDYNEKTSEFNMLLKNDRIINIQEIANLIIKLKLPDEFWSNLDDAMKGMGNRFIVRSSGKNEDGNQTSLAGVFNSYGDVGKDDLEETIKNVWISSFSPIATMFGSGSEAISVIIQDFIQGEQYGVAFSRDPLDQCNDCIVINGKSTHASVVNGDGGSWEERVFNRSELSGGLISDITDVIYKIESLFNIGYVDIEWIMLRNKIYVVQVRPLTYPISEKIEHYAMYSLESTECLNIDLDQLKNIHKRWFEKKYWARKYAISQNIDIPKGYYISYVKSKLTSLDVDKILEKFETKILVVDRADDKRTIFVDRNDLYKFLINQNEYNNDKIITVKLRELPEYSDKTFSGFSTMIGNDQILIEFIPGAFSGIYKYHIVPSYMVVDMHGNIISYNLNYFSEVCVFDNKHLEFVRKDIPKIKPELSDFIINEVIRISKSMADRFKEPRLEWTISNNKIILCDLSFEKKPFFIEDNNMNKLSNGDIIGTVFKLEDLNVLIDLCELHTVSVVPEEQFYRTQMRSSIKEIVNSFKIYENPIIVCKQPITELALIMDDVKGFIFEEGSFLCHLGIMLREKNIPAIFMNQALNKLENGKDIMFVDGRLSYER